MEDGLDASVLRALLERLPTGVMIVSGQGEIVLSNVVARRLLAAGDGLRVKDGRLMTRRVRESALLRRLVAEASCAGLDADGHQAMRVSRDGARSSLAVRVVPLPGVNGGGGLAAVFADDPTEARMPSAQVLRRAYGMTSAEIRVTTLLLHGVRVAAIAQRLGITTNTIRTHLKRVFAKTEARGQSDLLRILLTDADRVRPDEARRREC